MIRDGHGFLGFADLGGVCRDIKIVFGKRESQRACLIIAQEGHAANAVVERLSFESHSLSRLTWDDLTIVRIAAFDDF